jgi:hypothetical protein
LAPQLTPLEIAAIGIVGKRDKEWREHLDVGDSQHVDVLLRIDGTVSVGDNQARKRREKPEAEDLLAAVFAALGASSKTADKVETHLLSQPRLEPTLEARARACALIERLTVVTENPVYGNVTGKLTLTKFPAAALPLARV